jgi:cytoskeletal protein CcmA (bactofilin family)
MGEDLSMQEATTRGSADSNPLDEQRVGWIGRSLRIKGAIVSTENLTIDGDMEGTIDVGGHTLTIGPDAHVKADLAAKVITISGAVTGSVMATERLELRASGSVVGNLTAPCLLMADGAQLAGRVNVSHAARGNASASRPVPA